MNTNATKTKEQYALELPLIGDGFHGPMRITSANMYNGDLILNFNFRTAKSRTKAKEATESSPAIASEWRNASKTIQAAWKNGDAFIQKFAGSKGRLVDVEVNDGYIKFLDFSKPTAVVTHKAVVTAENSDAETDDVLDAVDFSKK